MAISRVLKKETAKTAESAKKELGGYGKTVLARHPMNRKAGYLRNPKGFAFSETSPPALWSVGAGWDFSRWLAFSAPSKRDSMRWR
jgi:hypothetical protein